MVLILSEITLQFWCHSDSEAAFSFSMQDNFSFAQNHLCVFLISWVYGNSWAYFLCQSQPQIQWSDFREAFMICHLLLWYWSKWTGVVLVRLKWLEFITHFCVLASAATLINIRNARKHFEKLENLQSSGQFEWPDKDRFQRPQP